jgi:Outer membrane cobalamin receptor protein
MMKQLKSVLCLVTLTIALVLVAQTTSMAAGQMDTSLLTYDIEAQSLKSALEIYQKTSGLNLAYSDDLVEGKMTDGVDGKNTTAQALKKILKDTGLTYMVTNQGTVVLKKNKMVVAQRDAEEKEVVKRPVEIEKIVVTATRTPEVLRNVPSSVSVITRNEIDRSTARTVDDLLRTKAGINVRKAGVSHTDNKITLRGLGKVLILIDGLQANDALGGQQLDNLPLESVERIEIVRGAASAVYGSEAMGGVVNIITKKPEKKLQGYIDGGGGNLDTYQVGGQLSGSYKDLGLLFTAKREETGGYIPIRNKYRKPGVSYKDQDVHTLELFSKLNYEITADSDLNLQFLRNYNHVDNTVGKKNRNRSRGINA